MTYNWQDDRESFKKWLVPTVLSDQCNDPDAFEKISEATDKFTKIEFGITINGIAVDADAFLDGTKRNMQHYAEHDAAEIVRENVALNDLNQLLQDVTSAAQSAVWNAVRGTDLARYLEEDYDR